MPANHSATDERNGPDARFQRQKVPLVLQQDDALFGRSSCHYGVPGVVGGHEAVVGLLEVVEFNICR